MLPYIITWSVIQGKQLWRTLWFPTANIAYTGGSLEPGVYKMNVLYAGDIYAWVGTYMSDTQLVEVHIFDFDSDIYGEEITIVLLSKLRENQKFDSLEALTTQITQDKKTAMSDRHTVLTFGAFDVVHEWHRVYLEQARAYGDKLVTIVALDETIHTVKWTPPTHPLTDRITHVQQIDIPQHTVVAGDAHNVYACLHTYSPTVIYLWYDQRSFDAGIIDYCTHHDLPLPTILRWSSYMPDVYKSSIIKKQTVS